MKLKLAQTPHPVVPRARMKGIVGYIHGPDDWFHEKTEFVRNKNKELVNRRDLFRVQQEFLENQRNKEKRRIQRKRRQDVRRHRAAGRGTPRNRR